MSCFLTRNIKHAYGYNPGGIAGIYLLDIRDFVSYSFKDDGLYTECFVEGIKATATYKELSSVNESNFTETYDSGLYKQQLTTFVRSLEGEKLGSLLMAGNNKYLVIFKTMQGHAFSFGSDGGASLSFTQSTGQAGEASGYAITLTKNSIYPLFEIAVSEYDNKLVWILEQGSWNDKGIWLRDGIWETE